jgi:hypothetical protein
MIQQGTVPVLLSEKALEFGDPVLDFFRRCQEFAITFFCLFHPFPPTPSPRFIPSWGMPDGLSRNEGSVILTGSMGSSE